MKSEYIVIRYHTISESFDTLAQAEEFAINCGDMQEIIQLTISEEK